jgi:hypothetical protein
LIENDREPNRDSPVRQRTIQRLPFSEAAVEAIAVTLDVEARIAPFRLPDGTVYQLTIPGGAHRPDTTLTLWPSIARADAGSSSATVVFTAIDHVELVEEVEVLFRRASGEYLIVARGGKIIVRS